MVDKEDINARIAQMNEWIRMPYRWRAELLVERGITDKYLEYEIDRKDMTVRFKVNEADFPEQFDRFGFESAQQVNKIMSW